MSAHARLSALWDVLEAQGAVVERVPLHTITARTANRLAASEEYRLAILSEAIGPPPQRLGYEEIAGPLTSVWPFHPQGSTSNPQGCSPSDPHPVRRTIERMFILDTGEVA